MVLHMSKKSWQDAGGSVQYEEDREGIWLMASLRRITRRADWSGYFCSKGDFAFNHTAGRNRVARSARVGDAIVEVKVIKLIVVKIQRAVGVEKF